MREVLNRIKSNKGETLTETLVSMTILAILMAAVTTMIIVSLRVTGDSMQRGREIQNDFNSAMSVEYDVEREISFSSGGGIGVDVTQDIFYNTICLDGAACLLNCNANIIAFSPRP